MLYYDLTERLLKVSISLRSGIRANSSVWYSGVANAPKKVIGIGTKVQDASMDKGIRVN
jgi:hypothetical protein